MVHDTTINIGLGIPTEFLTINFKSLRPVNSALTQVELKVLITGVEKLLKSKALFSSSFEMMVVVEVVQIMVNSPTTTDPTNHFNPMLPNIVTVDFFDGILVTTNDNRRFINPKKEDLIFI